MELTVGDGYVDVRAVVVDVLHDSEGPLSRGTEVVEAGANVQALDELSIHHRDVCTATVAATVIIATAEA
jgi:hypothetical protein